MNDRNNIINELQDLLGSEGDRDLAEQVFEVLRADGQIEHTDLHGLALNPEADVIGVAAEILGG